MILYQKNGNKTIFFYKSGRFSSQFPAATDKATADSR